MSEIGIVREGVRACKVCEREREKVVTNFEGSVLQKSIDTCRCFKLSHFDCSLVISFFLPNLTQSNRGGGCQGLVVMGAQTQLSVDLLQVHLNDIEYESAIENLLNMPC